MKKLIPLRATEITFNKFTIVYTVEFCVDIENIKGVVFCNNNIKTKELILMPTLIEKSNMEVATNTRTGKFHMQ